MPDAWREIGRDAGCHVISDANETLLAGNGLLAVHTIHGGLRTLHLPKGKSLEVTLPATTTSVFDLQTGELLLQ